MRKALLIPFCVVFASVLFVFPQNCIASAQKGLDIWLYNVLPSIFPFLIFSFALMETGVVKFLACLFSPVTRKLLGTGGEGAYVFLASVMSGYPVGARLTGELYSKGQLKEEEAQRILCFTSVAGPVFITGTVSTTMLNAPYTAAYLTASHYISALIIGIALHITARNKSCCDYSKTGLGFAIKQFRQDVAKCRPVGEILTSSIEKSLRTIIKIGGFIIFFSVLIEALELTGILDALSCLYSPLFSLTGLDANSCKAVISASIEIASGCARIAALDTALKLKILLISSAIAFGGVCVQMQTRAVLNESGLKPKKLLLTKSLHSIVSFLLTAVILALFPLSLPVSAPILDIQKAAYGGVAFAITALLILLVVKLWQQRIRKAAFTSTR